MFLIEEANELDGLKPGGQESLEGSVETAVVEGNDEEDLEEDCPGELLDPAADTSVFLDIDVQGLEDGDKMQTNTEGSNVKTVAEEKNIEEGLEPACTEEITDPEAVPKVSMNEEPVSKILSSEEDMNTEGGFDDDPRMNKTRKEDSGFWSTVKETISDLWNGDIFQGLYSHFSTSRKLTILIHALFQNERKICGILQNPHPYNCLTLILSE